MWTPIFTEFIHDFLKNTQIMKQNELYIGDVIQAAIDKNYHVNGVLFPNGTCLDIGMPDDLIKAVRNINFEGAV